MEKFDLGEDVTYKGRKGIVADRMQPSNKYNPHDETAYALWNHTGEAELKINDEMVDWIPESKLSRGW